MLHIRGNKGHITIISIFLAAVFLYACQPGNPESAGLKSGGAVTTGYDLSKPEKKLKLPERLKEISGLSMISDKKVACVQDEEGKIFVFDLSKEEITETVDFGKKGDYEGIAIVKKDAFAARSDGTIFKLKNWESENRETIEFKTSLSEKNDVEGICYDAGNKRLLIACKAKAGDGDAFKGKKAVYAFDLVSEKLNEEPAFLISMQEIKDSLKASTLEKIGDFLGDEGSDNFQPSGIEIHPVTGEIYIISSVGKLMVVLSKAGRIIHITRLDDSVFKQPEGITFLSNGDMLVSNEGQGGDANILMFKYGK